MNSTARTDMEKAELRRSLYEIFEDALYGAGFGESSRDALIDRGDGILTLIDPAVPKTVLLNEVVPTLGERLAEVAGLRLRTIVHAGEVLYDRRGVFGESVDLTFRLLEAP
ncbi:MAG TPA: hypothetical protein VFT95_00345 [Micromonosporaceae bacterium]|nr:hypothetical protein [Micromonosporaceae bacterium]